MSLGNFQDSTTIRQCFECQLSVDVPHKCRHLSQSRFHMPSKCSAKHLLLAACLLPTVQSMLFYHLQKLLVWRRRRRKNIFRNQQAILVNRNILLLFNDIIESRQNLFLNQRSESETSASRLNSWYDFAEIITDDTEAHIVGVLFDNCGKVLSSKYLLSRQIWNEQTSSQGILCIVCHCISFIENN